MLMADDGGDEAIRADHQLPHGHLPCVVPLPPVTWPFLRRRFVDDLDGFLVKADTGHDRE
jgi:hypothetical protein